MRMSRLLPYVQGCAVGVTLEALGVHHETLTPAEILALTDGRGLLGLTPPLKPLRFQSVRKIPLGGTSDDWQLWRAVARSLLQRGGRFDRVDVAREHVLELARGTNGWGSSTEDGVRRLRRAFDFGGVRELYPDIPPRKPHPPYPGENPKGKGCGNGVAMKVGPLAIASLMDGQGLANLWDWCHQLGGLTHPNPRAWIAAYALAWCVRDRLQHADREDMIDRLVDHLDGLEPYHDDRVADRLRLLRHPATLASAEALRESVGTSCYAIESVPFAIGSFLRHPADIRTGALEVLNAGGDTDTNVGMYAQLAGADQGVDAIPWDWREQIPDARQALAIGTALGRMVIHNGFAYLHEHFV